MFFCIKYIRKIKGCPKPAGGVSKTGYTAGITTQSIQTNYHIGLGCSLVNNYNTSELLVMLKRELGEIEVVSENHYLFLNASKNKEVINLLLKNLETHGDHLRADIEL